MADKHYRVTWQIDQWAPNPEHAARQARLVQRDPNSVANVFTARDMEFGEDTEVDLDDERSCLMAAVNSEEAPPYLTPGPVVVDKESELSTFHDDLVIERALAILKTRLNVPEHAFKCPGDTRQYCTLMLGAEERELFGVLFLNNRHGLLAYEVLFEGTIDGASIYPREVVKAALKYNAAAVIVTHNHPSGVPEPSPADERITKRLKEALALVDVRLLDHIIVGGTESVSLAERGVV